MSILTFSADKMAYFADHSKLLNFYSLFRRHRIIIFGYHRVSSQDPPWYVGCGIKPEIFDKEISHILKTRKIVSLDWLVEQIYDGANIPYNIACITFDDGYKDNYTNAFPILQKYNAPATIFLTTGYIGRSWPHFKARYSIWNTEKNKFELEDGRTYHLNSLNDRISVMHKIELLLDDLPQEKKNSVVGYLLDLLDVDYPFKYEELFTLSWNEIVEMSKNNITFGAHTVTHTNLTKLSIDEARMEIYQSKRDIEQKLRLPCNIFAYPNGNFNEYIMNILDDVGFKAALSSPVPNSYTMSNLLKLYRCPGSANFHTFKAYDSGLYSDMISIMNSILKFSIKQ